MNKCVIGITLMLTAGSVFADKAILQCRTSGFVHYETASTYSMNCGNRGEYSCIQEFERQIENEFMSLSRACKNALGSDWYHDKTRHEL